LTFYFSLADEIPAAIEQMRAEGRTEDEIRRVIQEMKTKGIDQYLNRHKIGEALQNENTKLLSPSTDGNNSAIRQGPLKLRNASVDYNKTHKLRKQELWNLQEQFKRVTRNPGPTIGKGTDPVHCPSLSQYSQMASDSQWSTTNREFFSPKALNE